MVIPTSPILKEENRCKGIYQAGESEMKRFKKAYVVLVEKPESLYDMHEIFISESFISYPSGPA